MFDVEEATRTEKFLCAFQTMVWCGGLENFLVFYKSPLTNIQ